MTTKLRLKPFDLHVNFALFLGSLILILCGVYRPTIREIAAWVFWIAAVGFVALLWPVDLLRSVRHESTRLKRWVVFGVIIGLAIAGVVVTWLSPTGPFLRQLLIVLSWNAIGVGISLGSILSWRLSREQISSGHSGATNAAMAHLKHFWTCWGGVPLFIFNSRVGLATITLLSPRVYDNVIFRFDEAFFGVVPTIPLSYLFDEHSLFCDVLRFVYFLLPVIVLIAAAALYWQRRYGQFRQAMVGFVVMGLLGWIFYLAIPVVGPVYYAPSLHAEGHQRLLQMVNGSAAKAKQHEAQWRQQLDQPAQSFDSAIERNCMPSLHTAWALLCALVAWRAGRKWFFALLPPVVLTIFSTVILRYHYVTDLLFAVPFVALVWVTTSLIVRRYEMQDTEQLPSAKRVLLFYGLVGVLIATFVGLAAARLFHPVLNWAAFLVLTVPIVWLACQISTADAQLQPRSDDLAETATPIENKKILLVLALFFASGFTGLLYEVAFEQQLALIFGSTAKSTITVLATYMAGLALGARFGGRIADRIRNPLRGYGLAELGVGIVCIVSPLAFSAAEKLYLSVATGGETSRPLFAVIRIGCSAFVLFVPALLMGATLPLLARYITRAVGEVRSRVAALYAANTLGAAAGTVTTAYALLPMLGRAHTIYLATGINFLVALVALRLAGRVAPEPSATEKSKIEVGETQPDSLTLAITNIRSAKWLGYILCGIAFAIGAVTFGLEISYVHLLAMVAGNSTYVFSLMLFSFLCGLGLGAWVVSRSKVDGHRMVFRFALTQAVLGMVIFLSLPLWNRLPDFFSAYATVSFAETFAKREFIRFSVCFAMMLGPTFFIGLAFPQLVAIASSRLHQLGHTIGRLSAFNTFGNIMGVLIVGFVLLPKVGSHRTITYLASTSLCVAAISMLALSTSRRRWAFGAGVVAAIVVVNVVPARFDFAKLTNGANVYFYPHSYGDLVEFSESLEGGVTSIHRRLSPNRGPITTMLTNGKFQGDDGPELPTQHLFAVYPLLHQGDRKKALAIGLGTGVSAGVLHAAGYQHVDVAELSPEIDKYAHQYFPHINYDIHNANNVQIHHTDGRNFLLLTQDKYNLISMEISSIWFAGAAALYGEEFYALAASRLTDGGVLQQWVQLHHIAERDLVAIIASARKSFQYLYFYYSGLQGVLICANQPAPVTISNLRLLEQSPKLAPFRRMLPGATFLTVPGHLILNPKTADTFLKEAAKAYDEPWPSLTSNDNNMFLAYSTPKGNVRPYKESLDMNLSLLMKFRGGIKIHSPNDQTHQLVAAAVQLGRRKLVSQWPTTTAVDAVPDWIAAAGARLEKLYLKVRQQHTAKP